MTKAPHFGCAEKIKALRESMPPANPRRASERGWSLIDLASKSGLTYQCLLFIENHDRIPEADTIYAIADALTYGRKNERDGLVAELVGLARRDKELRAEGKWPPAKEAAAS